MKKYTKGNWFIIIAGIMLLLAIPSILPYGYYQILRWVVTGVAVYSAYCANESNNEKWLYIMGAIAILFNPIFPIYLSKETWVVLDLITSIIMFVSISRIKK